MLALLYVSSLLTLISSTSHGQGCSNATIRLSDNSSVSYELCVSEFWDTIYFSDTICGNNWSLKNSLVVCKQLGYHDAWTHTKFRHPRYMQVSGMSFRCNGTENNISACGVTVDHNCSSVSVGCRRDQFINSSDVRLINAFSDAIGDVEIFFKGSWMPLCYHNINQARIEHVCRRLGWDSGKRIPPITNGVQCVGWTCGDVGCLEQYLKPGWAARIKCQQYDANNTMNMEVSLSDDGVPLVIHEGRQTRVCVSDHVLNGGDNCENISSLPLAICQHLGFNAVEIKTKNSTNSGTQQLPILMAGRSNCTICPSSLPQQQFLNDFTMCLPNDIEACNTSVDFVLTCMNINEEEEHHGFGVGAIIGIIIGVLLVLLFLSPFIGSSLRSCYKNCLKPWLTSEQPSIHQTATTNPGGSKVSESKGGHSLALSTSEAEPSTYESSTLTKTHSSSGVPKDPPPNYNETLKAPKQSDSTL